MTKFCGLIFLTFLLVSLQAPAASLRAQWINRNQIKLQLPLGVYWKETNIQFALVDDGNSLKNNSSIQVSLIESDGRYALLDTSRISAEQIRELVMAPLKVVTMNQQKLILDTTGILLSGILDQLYSTDEELGGTCGQDCTLKLWAPTAMSVRVHLYATSEDAKASAIFDVPRPDQGVWSIQIPARYKNYFYLYEITGYQPRSEKMETSWVTDPYSFSLSLNGKKSQLVDLDSAEAMPAAWHFLKKPPLTNPLQSVIYELHLRDFSASDQTVPETQRGTFLAFQNRSAQSVLHLKKLADAGLTHIHLLPWNDFGSVNEKKSEWPKYSFESGDLREPQSVIGAVRNFDAYNWGYDPVHYFTPEGSYAVQGDGVNRIKEARQMVQDLNELGLRVVQDVVFNHTYQNGNDPYSVFDKIVPLYYYRVDETGTARSSSCCPDTASEHAMMEKLMVDSIVHWAKVYKVDGFRFDLMSFHSRKTMEKIRDRLRALTPDRDGVDGSKILIYGEGWSFGSFYDQNPTEAMTLENAYGSGYGFFNDRLRDAARGGTTNSVEKSDQGFVTGLYFDFNHEPANRNTPIDPAGQRDKILHLADVIKVGLAGNLRDYIFKEHLGHNILAGDLKFRGSPVAVAASAIENINYVSAHDGYSVWDAVQAKASFANKYRSPATATLQERQRMQQMLLAIPLLGQGIPFIEAGSELLRSKNGDQDSYNSGDFFNRIDWSGQDNFWGTGLPPAWKNLNDWAFWQPRLESLALKPSPALIQQTEKYFRALLRVRKSSTLFSLGTLPAISNSLHFIDNDAQAEPGLIAMHLKDMNDELLVFFNVSLEARSFSHTLLERNWTLHPELDEKVDADLSQVRLSSFPGRILLPGRSTVILKRSAQ